MSQALHALRTAPPACLPASPPACLQNNWEAASSNTCLMGEEITTVVTAHDDAWQWVDEGKPGVRAAGALASHVRMKIMMTSGSAGKRAASCAGSAFHPGLPVGRSPYRFAKGSAWEGGGKGRRTSRQTYTCLHLCRGSAI